MYLSVCSLTNKSIWIPRETCKDFWRRLLVPSYFDSHVPILIISEARENLRGRIFIMRHAPSHKTILILSETH